MSSRAPSAADAAAISTPPCDENKAPNANAIPECGLQSLVSPKPFRASKAGLRPGHPLYKAKEAALMRTRSRSRASSNASSNSEQQRQQQQQQQQPPPQQQTIGLVQRGLNVLSVFSSSKEESTTTTAAAVVEEVSLHQSYDLCLRVSTESSTLADGDAVYVTGSHPALGGWDHDRAVVSVWRDPVVRLPV